MSLKNSVARKREKKLLARQEKALGMLKTFEGGKVPDGRNFRDDPWYNWGRNADEVVKERLQESLASAVVGLTALGVEPDPRASDLTNDFIVKKVLEE